jgi:hypothetical protein
MASEPFIRRYRAWYAKLLRLYPRPYRERFGEGMEQTFHDLCRERIQAGRGLFSCALWLAIETAAGIIRENLTVHLMQNKIIVRPLLVTGLILLIPFFGNLYVDGWNWPFPAFILAGTLLFASGLTYELVARKMNNKAYRFALGLAVATAFVLAWVNLVRVSESENAANLLYYGVIVIGALGAVIARFQPRGMALALFATALAQMLVPVILLSSWGIRPGPGPAVSLGGNAFFAMLLVASALLFRHAAASRTENHPGERNQR